MGTKLTCRSHKDFFPSVKKKVRGGLIIVFFSVQFARCLEAGFLFLNLRLKCIGKL